MAGAAGKPPYRVPTVEETAAAPRNGLTVASTFSGCGGSSYGYELAGFTVLWANEMVAEARASYSANHPDTHVDPRDIRKVEAADVLEATGLDVGELDLFDGSPPCQPFSMSGRRERSWRRANAYGDGSNQAGAEDLFFDYARLVEALRPRTFVAENVAGLVRGKAKGYFLMVLRRLRDAGYRVDARLLDAQWLGVPQRRQRLIFVGVRDDLGLPPPFPSPLPYRYSVRDACPWINDSFAGRTGSGWTRQRHSPDRPMPTVTATDPSQTRYEVTAPAAGPFGPDGVDVSAEELPPDIARFAIGRAAAEEGLGPGEQSRRYFSLVRADPDGPSPTVTAACGAASAAGVVVDATRKFSIPELRRICSFPDDYVLTGTYQQRWARLGNSVPPVMMRHVAETLRDRVLLPRD